MSIQAISPTLSSNEWQRSLCSTLEPLQIMCVERCNFLDQREESIFKRFSHCVYWTLTPCIPRVEDIRQEKKSKKCKELFCLHLRSLEPTITTIFAFLFAVLSFISSSCLLSSFTNPRNLRSNFVTIDFQLQHLTNSVISKFAITGGKTQSPPFYIHFLLPWILFFIIYVSADRNGPPFPILHELVSFLNNLLSTFQSYKLEQYWYTAGTKESSKNVFWHFRF